MLLIGSKICKFFGCWKTTLLLLSVGVSVCVCGLWMHKSYEFMLKNSKICWEGEGSLIRVEAMMTSIDENDSIFTLETHNTRIYIDQMKCCKWFIHSKKKAKNENKHLFLLKLCYIPAIKAGIYVWVFNERITCVCVHVFLCDILFSSIHLISKVHHHRCTFQQWKKVKWYFIMFWLWWAALSMQCLAIEKKNNDNNNKQKIRLTSTYANHNSNLFMPAIYMLSFK